MRGPQNSWLALSSIGFQIAAVLLIFGWIGHFIDGYFSAFAPLGLIIGLFLGAFLGLYEIWKIMNSNK